MISFTDEERNQNPTDTSRREHGASLVAATRIHLGKQSRPPPQSKLNSMVASFLTVTGYSSILRAAIAVDPAPKIEGYDLVQAVREAIEHTRKEQNIEKETKRNSKNHAHNIINTYVDCDIIPVTPWGNFVPALNALTSWAVNSTKGKAERILFISAETILPSKSIDELCSHVNLIDTLVAGAALPGHIYGKDKSASGGGQNDDSVVVELNGRTCPWNTCAIWNLNKLALTGFPLVADGLHWHDDGRIRSPGVSGIEEFSTILLSQTLRRSSACEDSSLNKAKLVKIPGVEWNQTFEDQERRNWHETKMESKKTRAERHRSLMGCDLKGWVIHC